MRLWFHLCVAPGAREPGLIWTHQKTQFIGIVEEIEITNFMEVLLRSLASVSGKMLLQVLEGYRTLNTMGLSPNAPFLLLEPFWILGEIGAGISNFPHLLSIVLLADADSGNGRTVPALQQTACKFFFAAVLHRGCTITALCECILPQDLGTRMASVL